MATSEVMRPDALDRDALEAGAQVRRIRDRLPGQTLGERIAQALARYGRVYTGAEVRPAAGPRWRAWFSRFVRDVMQPLEAYRASIPDDALLRYDDASDMAWFSRFCALAPARAGRDRPARWIVGQLRGGGELYAVGARWHTPAGPTGRRRTPHPHTREGETS